jgi:putative hemolysin
MASQLIFLAVLVLLSGFFSSAETALFSISRTKARHLAKDGTQSSLLIQKMKDDPHRLLSTVLIGNNIVNIWASALATTVAMRMFPGYAIGLATGVMTFVILVFGEVFPKSIATRSNVIIARFIIYPIYWLSILFFPFIWLLNFIPKLTGKISRTAAITEEELMTFVEVVQEEGEIKAEEKNLIHNIFEFDNTSAAEIMTPRADMFVIDADRPLNLEAIVRSGFTRVPVIRGDFDHVIGIINTKDLFQHQLTRGQNDIDIRKIMRDPYFVPENKKIDSLLTQFKKRRSHLAIVVDEHGGVSGLISLEDVIEELVGDIRDETDEEGPKIVKVKPSEWLVPGKIHIDDVNEKIPITIPDTGEYETFSGYVLDSIGRIPHEKEEIAIDGFTVTVKAMDGNRIREFIVRQMPKEETAVGKS